MQEGALRHCKPEISQDRSGVTMIAGLPASRPSSRVATRPQSEMMKGQIMRIMLAALALVGLAACETTEGFGRDVSSLGNTITEESQKAQ
ncbi:Entericidin EcnA/B family, putative [Ruegeria sp. R11]|nr:Entericidin EcnA/B family, putative [Ruegeria sp. R11]